MTDLPIDPIAIDVGKLLNKTVTSLYSHLVTRPTGRAVRMAIATQLQSAGEQSLSLIDLSEVVIIDFSCADEVVAKLLQEYQDNEVHDAFFVFRGVHEPHRDQIEVVLVRQGLAAVVETDPGNFQLLGVHSDREDRVWGVLEARGMLAIDEIDSVFDDLEDRKTLESLVHRGLAFRSLISGRIHSLSRLVEHLM
ncbi:MAG: hypothetical protein O2958_07535 [Gemmatimonadetes bacterium]|nr:hypothetical protein [Gemmatimonadota bacterium]MDA1104180.1 hypothetical protein [Gemmatimonadota bacterium]